MSQVNVTVDERAMRAVLDSPVLAMTRFGETFVHHIVQLSPFKFGTNRRSVKQEVKELRTKIAGKAFTESGYGGWLEVGTGRMAARPYFAPAFAKAVGEFPKIAREVRRDTEAKAR